VHDDCRDARHQLLSLLEKGKYKLPYFKDMPTDWRPTQVENPDGDGLPFTPKTVWHFIYDKLAEGHPIERVELDNPAGKIGYVMKIASGNDKPQIYVKLQLGSGCVLGRSFHYSEST
jgi:hypothetical protein